MLPYTDGRGQTTQTQIAEGAVPSAGVIPFRRATTFRNTRLQTTVGTVTAAEQQIQETIEGSGYMFGIDLTVDIETAANAAAVAYHEDAPFNAISSVVMADVNGELVNLEGFSLHVADLYGGWKKSLDSASADEFVFESVAGAVGRGGSVHFHLFVPAGTNRRTLLGLLGNQDRAQKYSIRSNFAASGTIYTVAPTAAGALTIQRSYQNYAVPAAANAQGVPQEVLPPKFGVLHYLTQVRSPQLPTSSSTQNHFLPRVGNVVRYIALIFRDGAAATARLDAEANMPTQIKFMLGDTPIFSETVDDRRALMFSRYGFDAPNGVLVYDWITDLVGRAADELGSDWLFTQGLVNAQFEITYGAGWAAASSLTIITDDLSVPSGMDLYA